MTSSKVNRAPRATLEQKIMVLDYHHASQRTQAHTVEHFRDQVAISTSSISEWLKEEKTLRAMYNDGSGQFRHAKRKLKFKYGQINREMDELVRTRRKEGQPITEPVLREYWKLFAARYGVQDPKRLESYSHGWLSQFKKRHQLSKSSRTKEGDVSVRGNDPIDAEEEDGEEAEDEEEGTAENGTVIEPIEEEDLVGKPQRTGSESDVMIHNDTTSSSQSTQRSTFLPQEPHQLHQHQHQRTQVQVPSRSNSLHESLVAAAAAAAAPPPTANNGSGPVSVPTIPQSTAPFLDEYNDDYMQSLQGYESLIGAQTGFMAPHFRAQAQSQGIPQHLQHQLQQDQQQQRQQQQQIQQQQMSMVSYTQQQRLKRQHAQQGSVQQQEQQQQQQHQQVQIQAQVSRTDQSRVVHHQQQSVHSPQQQVQQAQQQQQQQQQSQQSQQPQQSQQLNRSSISESEFELFLTKYADEFLSVHQRHYPDSHKLFVELCQTFRRERLTYSDRRLKELFYER